MSPPLNLQSENDKVTLIGLRHLLKSWGKKLKSTTKAALRATNDFSGENVFLQAPRNYHTEFTRIIFAWRNCTDSDLYIHNFLNINVMNLYWWRKTRTLFFCNTKRVDECVHSTTQDISPHCISSHRIYLHGSSRFYS